MNAQQERFIEAYVETRNASEAARRAGYSAKTARQQGSRLLTKVAVQAALAERLTPIITSDEVLERLTSHARGTMANFIDVDDSGNVRVSLKNAKAYGQLHLIKKIKTTRRVSEEYTETTVELELYDAQAALVQLGKYYRLFTDRVTVDWVGELEALGLDAHAIESEVVNQFEGHLARGQARLDGVGVQEGESEA